MAEFCLDCWNEINHFQKTEKDYVLSKELELCEGCGRLCRIIERERTGCSKLFYDLRYKNG